MTETQPLVSVIIPSFRHERFIAPCLESVVNQTHRRLELILVDDCSPDATYEIAERFLAEHGRRFERVVLRRNQVNRGAHAGLNRGVGLATGDFLSLMNSDDAYAPTRVATLVDALMAEKRGFAFSRVQTVDENGAPDFSEALCHHVYWRPVLMRRRYPSLSWAMLAFQLTASTGNMVLRRALAERIGQFSNLRYCHDWDYVLRACFYDEPLYVPEPLYYYRVHGENSFRALTHHAVRETQSVVAAHLKRVMAAKPFNPLAPAPQNWPGLFEALIAACGHQATHEALYHPYKPRHKTIEPSALAVAP
ncbi:MAG TPA: glycosyltransferase [Caulobacterales bacterium]|nr:glycosyltransferase [Vitreimonas sp.]HVY85333.1 glycosyltransferase [Caulobacterales bacterium]